MTQLIGRLPSIEGAIDHDDELHLLELQLIATKSTHHYLRRTPHNLFPTYPRRRKGPSCLMSLWANRGLIDESPNTATHKLLATINTRWNFNAFCFDRLTSGQNLATLCTYLFRDLGLLQHFRLDALIVWRFFATVERYYHATNPYHNGVHAADVTQAMACFINEQVFRDHLRPMEKMAAILAAVGHDLDHPGLNEKFLITTSSHLAGLYNNTSVLENHHWRTCVALMHETGLAQSLPTHQRLECEQLIQSMVLATDISRQGDFLRQLGQYLDQRSVDMSQSHYRHFMLQIALKCADISNPCRNWNISRLWSYRACEEFYRQGDRERELNLPVTPLFDRNCISVAKVQSTFYRNVAAPLFEEWHRAINTPLSANMMSNLNSNQARWDLICQQEGRLAGGMAESIVSTSSSSGGGGGSFPGESRRGSLEPPANPQNRFSRSSGDGDDDSEDQSYPYMPLDTSLAVRSVDKEELLSPRRNSVPALLELPETSTCLLESSLHRQLSLMEKRRSSAVHELRKQNSELLASLKVSKRRRIFAAAKSNCNKAASAEVDSTRAKVTFHLSTSSVEAADNNIENENCSSLNKSVVRQVQLKQRRGSAPCTLLLNQINKITTSATKAASTASREHSPRSGLLHHRRSSLPFSDEVEQLEDYCELKKMKKQRSKLLRRKSAGASDSGLVSGEPNLANVKRGGKNPALGKRGSLKSSSFGGVGTQPVNLYNGRLSWHGKSHPKMEVVNEAKILLRNNYSAALQQCNGRRGSLPLELILC